MPRHAAYLCLRAPSGKPLLEVDRMAKSRQLDERDTALVRRLVGTEIRRRATLRATVAGFAHQRPKPELAALLRLGIAQILFLDKVPEHAAVSETVRATTDFLGESKGRVVNGVLRNVLRALLPGHSGDSTRDIIGRELHFDGPVFRSRDEHPHLWAEDSLSVPAPLHKRWTAKLGAEAADELARIAMDEAPLSFRVRGESSRESVRAELDFETFEGKHSRVLLAQSEFTGELIRSAAFREGRVTIQGEHAFRASELVGDVAGKRVLDVCAAPGGKSAAIADGGPASITAIDLSPFRLRRTLQAFDRLGTTPPRLAALDGTHGLRADARFDAVFIDAPCSNTGVLAQRPAARWRYGPKSQSELAALQLRLLQDASQHVEPAGVLVYSTCSLEAEENQRVVKSFMDERPEWSLEETVQSLPGRLDQGGPIDGGYAARLRAPASRLA